jgi:hypothetical protein
LFYSSSPTNPITQPHSAPSNPKPPPPGTWNPEPGAIPQGHRAKPDSVNNPSDNPLYIYAPSFWAMPSNKNPLFTPIQPLGPGLSATSPPTARKHPASGFSLLSLLHIPVNQLLDARIRAQDSLENTTRNPQPATRNPLNPKPETRNSKLATRNPKPATRDSKL